MVNMSDDEQILFLREEISRVRERIVEEKKGNNLLKKCENIESSLFRSNLSPGKLVKVRYKIIALERLIDKFDFNTKKIFIWIIMMYGAFSIVLAYANSSEGMSIIEMKMGLHAVTFFSKYLGVFQFMLIGSIGTMTKFLLEEYKTRKDPIVDQILIALLFPVVFINVFSYNGSEIQGVIIINLLMFVCGFSVEFILLFLNRLMDVAKKAFNLEESPSRGTYSNETKSSDSEHA